MAIAKVTCICKKCGKEFTVRVEKHNRREADAWEEWAQSHYDTCQDCYAAAKSATCAADEEIVEMHYGEYKRNYADNKTVRGSYNPETKTIKVIVKKQVPQVTTDDLVEQNSSFAQKVANVTKSEIFAEAHRMAKETVRKYAGANYQVTFAACLREVYKLVKKAKAAVAKMAA